MSDFQMGPGWWQAADGKWYPPAPPGGTGPAVAAHQPPEKKRSKAPLLVGIFCGIPLLLVLVVGALGSLGSDSDAGRDGDAGGGGPAAAGDCDAPRDTDDTRNLCLYPDRPDRQDEDHEAEVGGAVRLSGYTATVAGSEVVPGLLDGQVLVVDVMIENRDDAAQPYNSFDWRLQTPSGQVIDPWGIADEDDSIGSGDLVSGGTVEGTVSFELESPGEGDAAGERATTGDYYLIYKPDPFDAARGIWLLPVVT